MDLSQFIDIFLHLDKHLANVVEHYGIWVYALLFAIIFIETGAVVMPFLPGDSLLFVAGTLAGILGDALNYSIGRYFGPKVFSWENSRFFNKEAFNRTHDFYEKHGPVTIIVARFLPFVRTFAPFVGGMAKMTYPRFAMYNIVGGLLWVIGLTGLGYLIGNTAWVKANFSLVTLAMIIVPGLPAVFEVGRAWLASRKKKAA
jgi:membrane-associated protein